MEGQNIKLEFYSPPITSQIGFLILGFLYLMGLCTYYIYGT